MTVSFRDKAERAAVNLILVMAHDLILEGWTQGVYARDAGLEQVEDDSDEAVFFCAAGALCKAEEFFTEHDLYFPGTLVAAATQVLESVICDGANLILWNDDPERTKAEVLEAFSSAIDEVG